MGSSASAALISKAQGGINTQRSLDIIESFKSNNNGDGYMSVT